MKVHLTNEEIWKILELKRRRYALLCLVIPLVLISIIGYLMNGATIIENSVLTVQGKHLDYYLSLYFALSVGALLFMVKRYEKFKRHILSENNPSNDGT